MRIDLYLYKNGFYISRTKAAEAIEKGIIKVNGVIAKPSLNVESGCNIEILETLTFVSNGGYKLEKARLDFGLDFSNKVFADIGASTGGYTDCLLKNGAKKVYAVDVGENQLDKSLLNNKNVVVMDNCNARTVLKTDFLDVIDGITVDCSFISLKLLLENLAKIVSETGYIVALIKPQFECAEKIKFKNGIIKDKKIQTKVCEGIYDFAIKVGLIPKNFTFAPIKKDKNVEFLILLEKFGKPFDKSFIKQTIDNI